MVKYTLILDQKPALSIKRRGHPICFLYCIGIVGIWLFCAQLNVKTDPVPVIPRHIYFIETTEPNDGILDMTDRQVCALESASLMNPEAHIHVYLFGVKEFKTDTNLWHVLLSLPNVEYKMVNMTEYLADTPLGKLVDSHKLSANDKWFTWHKADILRYAILSKEPGTYMDFDVISLKPENTLGSNWVIQQRPTLGDSAEFAAGAIHFGPDEVGRQLVARIVNDLAKSYNENSWSDSSVGVLTRNVVKWCDGQPITNVPEQYCNGLKIVPFDTFYAISWGGRKAFFQEDFYEKGLQLMNKSIGMHLWNYSTRNMKIKKDRKIVFTELFRRYCPNVFNAMDEYL